MTGFELIQAVLEISKDMSRPVYRGQAKARWGVESGAVRRLVATYGEEVLKDEGRLGEWVRQYQTDELVIPMQVIGGEPLTDLQMLSVLQHQSAATMLLDFTENPLVAFWFACVDKPESDGKVFAVDIGDPLAWTNGRKVERPLDEDQGLVYYEPDRSLGLRIVAQQSVFLICNPRIPERVVKEVEIPSTAKSGVREALERLGLSERVLFGDVSGLAAQNAPGKPLRRAYALTPAQCRRRGNRAYQERQFIEALAAYREYAERAPEAAEPHLLKGNALAALERYPEAVDAYTEAISRSGRPLPQSNVVWEQGFIEETLSVLHYNRGNAHAALGDHEAAVADFDQAVQHAANQPRDALFNRANSKYALGRFEESQRGYSAAGGNTRRDTALGVGNSQLMLGNFREALASYLAGRGLDPEAAALHCGANGVELERMLEALGDSHYTVRVDGNDLVVETECLAGSFRIAGNSGNVGNRWGGSGYRGARGFKVKIEGPAVGGPS